MNERLLVEPLSPLDLLMPNVYIRVLLGFKAHAPTSEIIDSLQHGLEKLSKSVPWLPGSIHPVANSDSKPPGLEIQWTKGAVAMLVNKGSIAASYEALIAQHMPLDLVPEDIWPVSSTVDIASAPPVFAASVFRSSDEQGVGLCVCMHHNVVDATGFYEVLRLWTEHMSANAAPGLDMHPLAHYSGRLRRLEDTLHQDLVSVETGPIDNLFNLHPEYSPRQPILPSSFPSCTTKIFPISVSRLENLKKQLQECMSKPPSTNTLLCALTWSAVTRSRMQRDPDMLLGTTTLVTAVNGRRRIFAEGASSALLDKHTAYLGNVVLYALSELQGEDVHRSDLQSLAKICAAIADSQSPSRIDSHHVAEVYSLVRHIHDYRAIFPGWDLFNSHDFTITSWADLPLYTLSFGLLSMPDVVRIPGSHADGVAIILPRKKIASGSVLLEEVLEVMVMLRSDDMASLSHGGLLKEAALDKK